MQRDTRVSAEHVLARISLGVVLLLFAKPAFAERVNYWSTYADVTHYSMNGWLPYRSGAQVWTLDWALTNITDDVELANAKWFPFGIAVRIGGKTTYLPYVSPGHWEDAAGNTVDAAGIVDGYELYPEDLRWPGTSPEWGTVFRNDIAYPYVDMGTLGPGDSFSGRTVYSVNWMGTPTWCSVFIDGYADASAVPEPSALIALFSVGSAGALGFAMRRRRRTQTLARQESTSRTIRP